MAITMPTVVNATLPDGSDGTLLDPTLWTALGTAINTEIAARVAAAGTVGTWTPADGSGAGLTFTIPTANYIKIGRLVYIDAQLVYPATANGANAKISGLPFMPAGRSALANAGSTVDIRLSVTNGAQVVDILSNVGVAKTNAQMQNVNMYLSGTYLST